SASCDGSGAGPAPRARGRQAPRLAGRAARAWRPASVGVVREAANPAVLDLRPGQLALDALLFGQRQDAGLAVDAGLRQRLELRQARRQQVGVDAHGVQAAEAAAGLRPLAGDLFAQGVALLQQPGGFAEANGVQNLQLGALAAAGI